MKRRKEIKVDSLKRPIKQMNCWQIKERQIKISNIRDRNRSNYRYK